MKPWAESFGLVLRPESGGERLDALDPRELSELLERHGALLLRDFVGVDLPSFAAFSARFPGPFLEPGGSAHARLEGWRDLRRVTAGAGHVELHSECAALPVRPDRLWFYCERPADTGGHTLLVDGVELWRTMPAPLRALFGARWLEVSTGPRGIAAEVWRRRLGIDDRAALEHRLRAQLERLDPRFERLELQLGEDDALRGRYVFSAVVPCAAGDAFANSITGPYEVSPRFEGGAPIPEDVLAAVRAHVASQSLGVAWRAGDVLMIDNARVMHGRLPFVGERRIYSRMSGRRCDFNVFEELSGVDAA